MEISIVKATEKDLPDILNLYKSTLDIDKAVLSIESANSIFRKILQYPDYHIFVVIFNTKIIGTFALLIMPNLAHFGMSSAIIEDVAVEESFQNKGIGKKMMEFAMEIAREKGCYKMVLSSNQKRTDAHRFYENLGFEKHGFSFVVKL